jgi:hypothetical protein
VEFFFFFFLVPCVLIPYELYSCKDFLPFSRLSLESSDCFLCCAEAVHFHAVPFVNSLSCWGVGVLLTKLLPLPLWTNAFSILTWSNFTVWDLSLRYLIFFELILVEGKRLGFYFSLLQVHLQFSQDYFLGKLSFLQQIVSDSFVQNQMTVVGCICVWDFYSILLIFMSLMSTSCASTLLFLLLWLCSTVRSQDL